MQGSSPTSSASAAAIGDYVVQHQGHYTAVGLMVVLSATLFGWFVATYSWVVQREAGETPLGLVALVTGCGLVALLAWDGILEVALAFLSHEGSAVHSPAMTELYQLENGVVMPGAYGFVAAAFLVAVAAAAFAGVGARPVGYFASLLAVLSAAGGVSGLSTVDGGTSSPVSYAPAVATVLITLVLAVGLLRRPGVDVRTSGERRGSAPVPV
jgi:MFS family permease